MSEEKNKSEHINEKLEKEKIQIEKKLKDLEFGIWDNDGLYEIKHEYDEFIRPQYRKLIKDITQQTGINISKLEDIIKCQDKYFNKMINRKSDFCFVGPSTCEKCEQQTIPTYALPENHPHAPYFIYKKCEKCGHDQSYKQM
jgi:hypothetical protein